MHPHFHEHMANQRREELLREAAVARILHNQNRPFPVSNNRYILWYLLIGSPNLTDKQSGQDLLSARYKATLRMMGVVALTLGVLIGSLLDRGFGLAPAALLDGAVVLALAALVVLRSIGLLRLHVMRGK